MNVGGMQTAAAIYTLLLIDLLIDWNIEPNCKSKPLWRLVEDNYTRLKSAHVSFPMHSQTRLKRWNNYASHKCRQAPGISKRSPKPNYTTKETFFPVKCKCSSHEPKRNETRVVNIITLLSQVRWLRC